MSIRSVILAAAMLAATPVLAQAPDSKAARDAKNWEAFQQLYPARAILAREEGLVGFKVKIDASGTPTECTVTHTSGHRLLDQETCQLIMTHATFKRPEGSSLSQERLHEGVVNWKLPTTPKSAVAAAPKPIAAGAAPEKLICKRVQKTGSNAEFERTCLTRREWDRAQSETQDTWGEFQGKKGMTNGR